ncbi:MAG: nucleoside deaminase [Firmicutes bacterium]|nr:nucleoside deaminase [Bacillota bacterium]
MDKDLFFMEMALEEAKKAYLDGEIPVGAVIVRNGEVLARAYNTKDKNKNVLCHAEINCINEASKKLDNWRLSECEIYITMLPCPMCAGALAQSRVSRIVYGTIPNTTEKELVDKIFSISQNSEKIELVGGILADTCGKLIQDFFKERRKEKM